MASRDIDSQDVLDLLDWKRSIFDLYRRIRASEDPKRVWDEWRETRDRLFKGHPQSPIPEDERSSFQSLNYFDYDPAFRIVAPLKPSEPVTYQIPTSRDGTYAFTRFAITEVEMQGAEYKLEAYWLEGYGGGLFLPFRDATSGKTTYGACRYLLDTVKGADLGTRNGSLVLDFNFAYNPSCAYDPQWVCPLAPPPNRLDVVVEAGERWAQPH